MMMRKIFIISVIILLALGCNKKDEGGTSNLPESTTAGEQEKDALQDQDENLEANTDAAAMKKDLDPLFEEYEYPASDIEDTFSMGTTISAIYKSADEFDKVVAFYKQKFPDAPPQSSSTVYFGKTLEDGSGFTVTLTQINSHTQIILRLDKKS
jgi:hypothetical protein